jgi:glycosyltransferase involved in cell wall biosynthesis
MKNLPKITVGICVFNGMKYLRETLESLRNQTFTNYEIFVVDDASSDGSAEFIFSYMSDFCLVKIHRLEENCGLAYARNTLLNLVETKYLVFLDSDDVPMPSLLERLCVKVCSDESLMAVGCYHKYIDSNSKVMSGGLFVGPRSHSEFIEKSEKGKFIFLQPTAIIDREYALKAGGMRLDGFSIEGPRYRDLCEDLDLWCRMSDFHREGKAILVIPEILSHYRKHNQALSKNTFGMLLRMAHIKQNLKERRSGRSETCFEQFFASMNKDKLKEVEMEAKGIDAFRRFYYSLTKGHIFPALLSFSVGVISNPKYLYDKILNRFSL